MKIVFLGLGIFFLSPALLWAAPFSAEALKVPAGGKSGFSRMRPESTGVSQTNRLSDQQAAENQIRMNGSGVALGDVDGDGRCDIFLPQLTGGSALYRNLGNWKFSNITASAGVACANQFSTGAALVDIDGDGDLDLFICGIGTGVRFFANDGKARFTEKTSESGLASRAGSMSMAFADLEGDGDLDLYVANYRTNTMRSTGLSLLEVNGRRQLRPEDEGGYELGPTGLVTEHGEAHHLFLNLGGGRFESQSWVNGRFLTEDGLPLSKTPRGWGLAVQFRDFNHDLRPDLYVCNDFGSPDWIATNDGAGNFRAVSVRQLKSSSGFSMGVDFADIDRDGDEDFLVVDMLGQSHQARMTQILDASQALPNPPLSERLQKDRNTLHLNNGDGSFSEIASFAGIEATGWSWSPVFLDVDLDGWNDLLITCGHLFNTQDRDAEEIIRQKVFPARQVAQKLLHYPRLNLPSLAFRNQGNLTFADSTAAWGLDLVGVAHGMALGDLDDDGDLDLVINALNQSAALYRNESSAGRISVSLEGQGQNKAGIGARLQYQPSGGLPQLHEMSAGGRYLSSDQALKVFAATSGVAHLEVTWRSGKRSVVTNVAVNQRIRIRESDASPRPPEEQKLPARLFSEVSTAINFRHQQEGPEEKDVQESIPLRPSELTPGISWGDLDGNRDVDLLLPAGKGGITGVFRNAAGQQFQRLGLEKLVGSVANYQLGIFSWSTPGSGHLLIAQNVPNTNGIVTNALLDQLELWAGGLDMKQRLPLEGGVIQAFALGDLDGDGSLEIFLGGGSLPGRYPEAAKSWLIRREGGRWAIDAKRSAALKLPMFVSSALFADLNQDGRAELITAGHWDSLHVFQEEAGALVDVTSRFGLERHIGIWNALQVGDFDQDGMLEIVAGNWGRNTQYERGLREGVLSLYYGDSNQDGRLEWVEAYRRAGSDRRLPFRDLAQLSESLPWLRSKFSTHRQFAEGDLGAVLRQQNSSWREVEATRLESVIFKRKDGKFTAEPLPAPAQFSPVTGLAVADFNGDGHEDLFLAQNFYGVADSNFRLDSGRSAMLLGKGNGSFLHLPPSQAGIEVDGDGRGTAVSDFNGDGRPDLAVSQFRGGTLLYRNDLAREGLRVGLQGPEGNPLGLGAQIRLVYPNESGPVRNFSGMAGLNSQDGSVQVLARKEGATGLWVRWPGGKTAQEALPAGAREVTLPVAGGIKMVR